MGNSMKINKGGRPKIEFSDKEWGYIENLCGLMCTGEEIAGFLGVSYDTLEKRIREVHDCSFTDYYKRHSAKGRVSLRRSQFKAAEGGNATMLVWLGKQYLGQTDKVDLEGESIATPVKIVVDVKDARKDGDQSES